MCLPSCGVWRCVNRHTGGLENRYQQRQPSPRVNRHTGGLEKQTGVVYKGEYVNRHTGGLEKNITSQQLL